MPARNKSGYFLLARARSQPTKFPFRKPLIPLPTPSPLPSSIPRTLTLIQLETHRELLLIFRFSADFRNGRQSDPRLLDRRRRRWIGRRAALCPRELLRRASAGRRVRGHMNPNPLCFVCFCWKEMVCCIDVPPGSGVFFALRSGYQEVYGNSCVLDQTESRKRVRDELCPGSKSKACREKMRRDRLNDRFSELSSVLDPGRPPKTDKASILSDATRVLTQLKSEADQLKEANEKLRETIKELKVEKNELRDEKMRLKLDKEKLEHQVKAMSIPPAGFMPHPIALHPAAAGPAVYAAHGQAPAKNAAPYNTFPGVAMWQWLPPAVLDTTQDPKLWPPHA